MPGHEEEEVFHLMMRDESTKFILDADYCENKSSQVIGDLCNVQEYLVKHSYNCQIVCF